jgi:hypothetical protein
VSSHEAIDRDFGAHLERIRDFLRIPSVSANDGDLRSTADAVCELIELAGGTAAPREPGEKRPTVVGVIDGPGPTVLRYGMYGIQPPGAQCPMGAGRPSRALPSARSNVSARVGSAAVEVQLSVVMGVGASLTRRWTGNEDRHARARS